MSDRDGDKIVARWRSERARARGHAGALGHVRPARAAVPDRGRRRRGDRALPADRRARRRCSTPAGSRSTRATASPGRRWSTREGSPRHQMWLQNQFHQYVRHEVVPAIRTDCKTAGHRALGGRRLDRRVPRASRCVCRFPDVFTQALAHVSGTYDLRRFFERATSSPTTSACRSPLHFVPHLGGPAPRGAAHPLHPARLGRGPGRGHRRVVAHGQRARRGRASRTGSTRGAPSGTTTG